MDAAGKRFILYSAPTAIRICDLSDLHLLSAACCEEKIKEDVAGILADPNAFWFGGGDYAECIGCRDVRFDPDAVDKSVTVRDLGRIGRVGYERARDILAPIKHKGLGMLQGNHERSLELHSEQSDRTVWLCQELGLPNLHYSAFVDVVLVNKGGIKKPELHLVDPLPSTNCHWNVRFFLHHGAGFAQTPAGKLTRLGQFMDSFEADVYMVGHVHDQIGRRQPILTADRRCKKLVARDRVGVIAGSYLKTYAQNVTTYGEQRGYRPTNLGMAQVMLCPNTDGGGRIKAEV